MYSTTKHYAYPGGIPSDLLLLALLTDEYQLWVLHEPLDSDFDYAGGPLDAPIERKPF